METDQSDQSVDKPKDAKRPKMDTSNSTSPKFPANTVESPILTLPADVLAKIIAFVPTAQWPSFDLLRDFHDATRIAWRDLRSINLDRDLLIKRNRPSLDKAIEFLVERSPLLTSLSGIDLRVESNSDVVRSLAKFEHLQSIIMGDAQLLDRPGGVRLDALVEFLESTRSRATLKELQLFNVEQTDRANSHAAMLDRFHLSLVNVQEFGCNESAVILRPFKLDKFSFSTSDRSLYIILDTLDSTNLTELRLGKTNVGRTIGSETNDGSAARVEPVHLINLIERAPNLRRIELFLGCESPCGQRLEVNKKLLAALANHENLTTIEFDFKWSGCVCLNFAPEFVEMLKAIGGRGQLRKLVLPDDLWKSGRDEIYSTIHEYIPYLRSIKLNIDGVNPEIVSNIVSMTKLEEVHLSGQPLHANAVTKISQRPHLKRLAISGMIVESLNSLSYDCSSLQRLAKATTLMDLRIRNADFIWASVFEKWSEGFGSNLHILMLHGIFKNEVGLIRLLEKAVQLRILILEGEISDRSMMTISKLCPHLEILGVRSASNGVTVHGLQEILYRCPKLRRLSGIENDIRSQLQIPKYRKLGVVDMEFWKYDFDDGYYE